MKCRWTRSWAQQVDCTNIIQMAAWQWIYISFPLFHLSYLNLLFVLYIPSPSNRESPLVMVSTISFQHELAMDSTIDRDLPRPQAVSRHWVRRETHSWLMVHLSPVASKQLWSLREIHCWPRVLDPSRTWVIECKINLSLIPPLPSSPPESERTAISLEPSIDYLSPLQLVSEL